MKHKITRYKITNQNHIKIIMSFITKDITDIMFPDSVTVVINERRHVLIGLTITNYKESYSHDFYLDQNYKYYKQLIDVICDPELHELMTLLDIG